MTTTNDGGPDTTNAGPVLPSVREPDATDGYTKLYFYSSIEAYGLQCWNACAEQVAGPLRERVAELERERDRLRAESVIEWEPGRSYTAAELLRRAIRGLRVRKDSGLWPAVRNMCGVGSGVAHFLCRWAGRDPDTGADLNAARAVREG